VVLASVSLKRGEEAAGGKTGGFGSSFILSLLVVQDLDKLAVIDSSCKCIINSLYLNRSTQWYCSESGEMKVFVGDFWIKKTCHVLVNLGPLQPNFGFVSYLSKNTERNLHCQYETKIAKRSLIGTKPSYNEIKKGFHRLEASA
jgi:hypothetical protein